MRRLVRATAATAAALALTAAFAAAETRGYKLVVHKDNPVRALPRQKAAFMFIMLVEKWDDGSTVLPVDQPAAAPVRESFSKDVHNRDTAAVVAAWQKIIFAGRGTPPPEKPNDEEVLKFVAERPGAIGYVSEGAPTDRVKVIDIIR